jgi:hypothetical protein
MTDTTDLLNAGEQIESGGKAWTFSHVGPGIRADFCAAWRARAREGLRQERKDGSLNPNEWREEADALKARFDSGAYSWGSPLDPNDMGSAITEALQETPGMLKLAQLLLKPRHGELSLEEVATILKGNPVAFRDALQSCLNAVPNAEGPAATASRPMNGTAGAA